MISCRLFIGEDYEIYTRLAWPGRCLSSTSANYYFREHGVSSRCTDYPTKRPKRGVAVVVGRRRVGRTWPMEFHTAAADSRTYVRTYGRYPTRTVDRACQLGEETRVVPNLAAGIFSVRTSPRGESEQASKQAKRPMAKKKRKDALDPPNGPRFFFGGGRRSFGHSTADRIHSPCHWYLHWRLRGRLPTYLPLGRVVGAVVDSPL